jgi:hypothetical protein
LRVGTVGPDVLFDDDEWPDEPDEPDPERRWGLPERDLPSVPETAETDVDPELFKTFWASVIFANVALFGLSLGAMLIVFRGNWTVGLVLITVGGFALARTWAYYVSFRDRDEDDPDDDRTGA